VEERVQAVLAADPRIANIRTAGYSEEFNTFTVTEASFSLRDRPGSSVTLLVGDVRNLSQLRVIEIGGLRPTVFEKDSRTSLETPSSPSLGEGTEDRLLGWELGSVSDLVMRYDDVVAYFQRWPEYPATTPVKTAVGGRSGCLIFGWTYLPPTE
jgi:hypothetical protein